MNNDPKTEMEELFSAYLDDALSERQQTELKRLLDHQPEIAEQLHQLRRQRHLLCALPIETAPPSLADDVQARLERKFILNPVPRSRTFLNRLGLLRRRIVAAAAMLLLPVALLGYVVWHIVGPMDHTAEPRTTAQAPQDDDARIAGTDAETATRPDSLPFDGVLVLTTQRPMLMAQSIEKQIFLLSLEHQTVANRMTEHVTFRIDCSADAMAEFIESIKPLWAQLDGGRLVLKNHDDPDQDISVPHVRPEQIQALVSKTERPLMYTAAQQFASVNTPLQPSQEDTGQIKTVDELPIPRPFLAWPQRQRRDEAASTSYVGLLIEVQKDQYADRE